MNYWTLTGGLGEVVSVLPSKEQADMFVFEFTVLACLADAKDRLVANFFACVDPVYPLLHRVAFDADYDAFWRLSPEKKSEMEPSLLALIMIILAVGTQFMYLPSGDVAAQQERSSSAELFASACHQALHLGAYLNRTSVQTLQAMIFMTYFLMNVNQATAAWAFSGIMIRQAYALGLNRDPSLLMHPPATRFQRAERRRLWQSIVTQETFLSIFLGLPPAATHADIDSATPLTFEGLNIDARPRSDSRHQEQIDRSSGDYESSFDPDNDIGYVNSMYPLALLVQESIASPRSLSLPLARTPQLRSQLLSRFRTCYRSFPEAFRAWDEQSIRKLYHRDIAGQRLVRQIMFTTTNYWHCIMLIQQEGTEGLQESLSLGSDPMANKKEQGGPIGCLKGTLEAAHEALRGFFVIDTMVDNEAATWWMLCHRAFTEAVCQLPLIQCFGNSTFQH